MSKQKSKNGEGIDKILTALGKMLLVIGAIWGEGIKQARRLPNAILALICGSICLSYALGYRYYHLRFLYWGNMISLEVAKNLVEWGHISNGLTLMGTVGSSVLLICGLGPYCAKARASRAL